MTAKVSVIIPTYNRAELVRETVESVINQTFKDFEILVIDDGSTDDTRKVLGEFSVHPNFHYYFQENKGRSIARNFGMEIASGEYLMFLDSDDLLLPDALQTLYGIAEKYPDSGVVGGRVLWIDTDGKISIQQGSTGLKREVFSERLFIEKIRLFFLAPSTYIIRKPLAQQLKGFKPHMHVGEDMDLFLRYCDAAPISVTQKVVVHMRRHENNTPEQSVIDAIRRIAVENFDALKQNPSQYPPDLVKAMKTEWQIRLAEDYYVLNDNSNALKHYLTAVTIAPALLLNTTILKRTFMTLVPSKIREKVKSIAGNNKK